MSMRMAITKVLCSLVRIAILMNAMQVSVLAMNSNNASNSVSNHSDSSVSLCSNVIYVPDSKDQVFEVTADYVDISGITVKGAEWEPGIYHINVAYCCVINNYVSNNYNGITLMHSSGNMVSNNSPIELGNYTLILHATDERGNRASPKQCNITAVSAPESAIFDTGEETYTYPCKGSGGYSEYLKIGNSTGKDVEAYWKGCVGDWDNITFNETFVLYKKKTYNYTIKTGSYPQIIHGSDVFEGWITNREFTDANGHSDNNWIPAIRLEGM